MDQAKSQTEYAKFDLQTSSIPKEFFEVINSNVTNLCSKKLETYDFLKELMHIETPLNESSYDNDLLGLIHVPNNKPTKSLERQPSNEITQTPDKEELIALMMQKTNQPRDISYFYLDSMQWDLESAFSLWSLSNK